MKSRFSAAVAAVILAVGLAGTAQAQIRLDRPPGGGGGTGGGGSGSGGAPQQMMDSISPSAAAQILQAAGYKNPQVLNLQGGDLKAVKLDLNGTPVIFVMADCKGESCASYAFLINFGQQQVNADFLNKYNGNGRYARLFTNNNNEVVLMMDGNLFGGVSPGNIAVAGALFGGALKTLLSN